VALIFFVVLSAAKDLKARAVFLSGRRQISDGPERDFLGNRARYR
jgi:hypothetical protein